MPDWSAFEQPLEAAKHEPITLKRVAIGAGAGALLGAGLAAHFFAYTWLQDRGAWAHDGAFGQVVGVTTVIGLVAYYVVLRILNRVDIHVTPWIAAPVAMWVTAERLVHITPHADVFDLRTSQANIAALVVFAVIVMAGVAIVRFFDWHIGYRERREIEREQARL